jgi:hypothetical protein
MQHVLFEDAARKIIPARKLEGTVAGVYRAGGAHFETEAVDELVLGFEGIAGDLHAGWTRRSGSREPWYKRGTEMRNERQLTLVAPSELSLVASAMAIRSVEPEWLGANLSLDGIPHLSMLPSGTLIFFESGATLKVDAQNGPCRDAGRQIALRARIDDPQKGELLFPRVAKRLRGLVAWVERPGTIRRGETAKLRIPEQWIY